MDLANESMLNVIFRVNNELIDIKEPDPPIIKEKGVSIIDWSRSNSDAVNKYLNRLIRLQLSKYFRMKNEKKIKEKNQNNLKNKTGLSLTENETDEVLISVFDGFGKFNEIVQLIDIDEDLEGEQKKFHTLIEKLIEPDSQLFYLTLKNYFDEQFHQISNRLLIIVYIKENYFEKFLNFISQKNEFYFHLIIITFSSSALKLPRILRGNFKNFKYLDYLKITESLTDSNCIEIKNYDKNIFKDVLHFVNV